MKVFLHSVSSQHKPTVSSDVQLSKQWSLSRLKENQALLGALGDCVLTSNVAPPKGVSTGGVSTGGVSTLHPNFRIHPE